MKSVLAFLLIFALGCGDPAGLDPADLAGTWRSQSAVSNGAYTANLRITVATVMDPNDLDGSWGWGLDYGGGVTGGSITGGSVSLTMRDFDTLQQFGFSGTLDGSSRLEGTFQGIFVVLLKGG